MDSLPTFATQTVTVIRPGSTTDHGVAVFDWTDAPEHDIDGCTVQPVAGAVNRVGRDEVASRALLVAPSGADIQVSDRVRVGGTTFDIEDLRVFETGVLDHVEANLVKVEG